jgi:N-acylneuraminate cytidylyltransferase
MKLTHSSVEALLPLRGGSKGIPRKNLRLFNGKPLFYWAASAIIGSGISLTISSDSDEILECAGSLISPVKLLKRPSKLATDHSSTESVIEHFLDSTTCEHIILVQATSPLTQACHVKEALNQYLRDGYLSLVSGTMEHRFFWECGGIPMNYDPRKRPRRQDWSGTFQENGAIYIFSRDSFKRNKSRCVSPSSLFVMESTHAIELDSLEDWLYLESVHNPRY